MMATEPPGQPDRRLAGLDDSLRMLRDRLDALRRGVARLEPEEASTPRPAPPATPQQAPPAAPHPTAAPVPPPPPPPTPEGDELVARLRGLLDDLKGLTGEAASSTPPAPQASGSVAAVDAGPFTDLVALRSFEERLMRLPAVQDLRVRRFSSRRAEIQLLLAPGASATDELMRLGFEAQAQPGAPGTVRVELPGPPAPPAGP